jgi:hypothetical protein
MKQNIREMLLLLLEELQAEWLGLIPNTSPNLASTACLPGRSSVAAGIDKIYFLIYLMDLFFLIGIVGDGVQLGPLGTAATNRPIVPAPGDLDDG